MDGLQRQMKESLSVAVSDSEGLGNCMWNEYEGQDRGRSKGRTWASAESGMKTGRKGQMRN